MTNPSGPLLSIVIPTRNRQHYVVSAIKSILSIPSEDLELIIQDNSNTNDLEPFAQTFIQDRRLRYIYNPSSLSFADNFTLALSQAKGEYLCSIGDDDVVNPEIIVACRWAKKHKLDAIGDNWRARYFWPDFKGKYLGGINAGKLLIHRYSGKSERIDPESELQRCVISGGVGMQRLPKTYLGIVRTRCLLDTLSRVGSYPVGTCPDMFLAVAVASFVKRMCLIDYPLVVPGFSTAGAGQLIALRHHQGRLEDAPHLRARKGYKWPDLIPKFYSVHTFFAESAFSALHATGRSDLILKFNLPALYALCILLYPKWLSATLHSIRLAKQSTCQNLIQFLACFVSSILKLLVKLTQKRVDALSMRPGRAKLETQIAGVNDTKEAMQALSGYLNRKGKIFDDSTI